MPDSCKDQIDWDRLSSCGRWSVLHVLLPLDAGCSIAEIADAYGRSPRWARTLVDALLEELKAQTSFDTA
jgi:uncharacterized protein (DUF433 family)